LLLDGAHRLVSFLAKQCDVDVDFGVVAHISAYAVLRMKSFVVALAERD
jgi:hypothetical protein